MILLTGATGFVGSSVMKKLTEAGIKVKPYSRRINGDIFDGQLLAEAMQGCDAVIHLVGIIREQGMQTFERVHVEGTRRAVQAAKDAGIRKFIHMSALGTRPNAQSLYHQTKWLGEEAVRASGISYVIFRPSIIFGKGDGFIGLLAKLIKSPLGWLRILPVIGNGKNRFQPIWVEDVAACFAKAAADDRIINAEYALSGPEVFTYDELLDLILGVLNKRRTKLHIPLPFARLMASAVGRFSRAPLSRDQITMLEEDNIGDNSAMIRDFEIHPRQVEETLKTYLK